jgi:hypothetical protein
MYEHRTHRLVSRAVFFRRVARHGGLALIIMALALSLGVLGYHFLGKLGWVDALLNASMILSGMGPVDPMPSSAAKVFSSFYALLSGLVFIGVTSILLAPFLHRLMHRFHLEER